MKDVNLEPVKLNEEKLLCYSQNDEKDKIIGCIGHLRLDFGNSGNEFHHSWFEHINTEMNNDNFKDEVNRLVSNLIKKGKILSNRSAMIKYCAANLEAKNPHYFTDKCWLFRELKKKYVFYIRCTPGSQNYDSYIYCYNREKLFKHLAAERNLPLYCYSELSATKEKIRIDFAENGFRKCGLEKSYEELNQELGITKAQKEAMVVGSLYNWNCPGADPKNYDENGKPQKNYDYNRDEMEEC